MSSNSVTTVTLPDIMMLIRQFPLRSYRIQDWDLDTRFPLTFGYPFTSRRWNFMLYINARQIVIWLKSILEQETNELLELSIEDQSNLEHFIGTMRNNFETDIDVRKLLENSILENFIEMQNL